MQLKVEIVTKTSDICWFCTGVSIVKTTLENGNLESFFCAFFKTAPVQIINMSEILSIQVGPL